MITNRSQPLKLVGAFVLGVFAAGLLFFFMMVATDPGDNLVLLDAGVRSGPSGGRVVEGDLRNMTDRPYAHVRALITLVSEDGRVLDTMLAMTEALDAGKTWTFRVPVTAAVPGLRDGSLDCRFRSVARSEPLISFTCRAPFAAL